MSVIFKKLEGWKLTSIPIDYKRLTQYDFPWANFDKDPLTILHPDENGYVTETLAGKLIDGNERRETCIVNIGVGRGKTTAAYKVIDHFIQQEEFIVIVISPFKKLVERDYLVYKDRARIIHYEMLETLEVNDQAITQAQVHFITINTLIGNPGDDNFEMTLKKRAYIDQIQRYCLHNNKKVVFLFDELHAGINVFTPEFALNLFKWRSLTHKCYLLSATYTESSKMVIEYFAALTDYNLKIYEVQRSKFKTQSNLHLLITNGNYPYRDLSILKPLADIILKAKDDNKKVHIITAYKELANSLCEKNDIELCKAINKLDYNLLTGTQTKNRFDSSKSNIGTTFFTGISFEDVNDILILLLPSYSAQPDSKIGGIFTDGKTAINQAIARLRTDGDIYVVMPMPETVIQGDYLQQLANVGLLTKQETTELMFEDKQYTLLWDFYNKQKKKVQSSIDEAEKIIAGNDWKLRAPLSYMTFGQFLLDRGDEFLASRYESFGKGYSPYMLWAAMNDQFENTTLSSISILEHEVCDVVLNENTLITDLKNYYGTHFETIIKGKSLYDSYQSLLDALKNCSFKTGESTKTKIIYQFNGFSKTFDRDDTKWPYQIKKEIINLLHLKSTGIYIQIEAEEYVRIMLSDTWGKFLEANNDSSDFSDIDKLYILMYEVLERVVFTRYFQNYENPEIDKNGIFIDANMLNDKLYYIALAIIKELRSRDPFYRRTFQYESIFRFPIKSSLTMPDDWLKTTLETIDETLTSYTLHPEDRIRAYDTLSKLVFAIEPNYKTKRERITGLKFAIPKKIIFPKEF